MPTEDPIFIDRRSSVLTEADLEKIVDLLSKHPCRYNLTHEEMDEVKRFSRVLSVLEKTVSDAIKYTILAVIAGLFWLLANHGYWGPKK